MDTNINNYENDFKIACDLVAKELSQEEIVNYLKNGNIQEKQISAILFNMELNNEVVYFLIKNLTGCDGKIREAISWKIYNLVSQSPDAQNLFANTEFAKIFALATIDINANICRNVIDTVKILNKYENFAKCYIQEIIKYINEAHTELAKFIYKDKKYVINKQLFKLYWCLETMKNFIPYIEKISLIEIIYKSSTIEEYTIREKCASLVKDIEEDCFLQIKTKLSNDENYYVRAVFN